MKILFSILIVLLSIQEVMAQKNPARKDYLFENPDTKEQLMIGTRDRITVRLKITNVIIKGIILSLSDSSLILDLDRHPGKKTVLFRNIANIAMIAKAKKRVQESSAKKYFMFGNPVTKEQIKIEEGNKVTIHFKRPDTIIAGTILALSDSSLILGFQLKPYRQIVPFRNIADMKVITETKKRYIVRIELKNGKTRKGELIRITQDSLSIQKNPRNYQLAYLAASEIKSIRIHGRRAMGKAILICAGAGLIAGSIIGYDSHPIPRPCPDPLCLDEVGAIIAVGIIGGVAGAAAGVLIGLASGRVFRIEGNQAQFDVFANDVMR